MNRPTVSVLTPSYQYARFLGDALESTSDQACLEEHIVLDAESTDGTVELLASRPADRLIWKSEPDDGQSDALNRALALAGGDWIGWLNADEFYLPGALEAVANLATRVDADVIFGGVAFVDESGRFMRLVEPHRFSRGVLRRYGTTLLSGSVFFRRAALPVDPWDVRHRVVMDWDIYLRMAEKNARFVPLCRPLSAYRVHGAQVTATPLPADSDERLRIYERYGIPDRASLRGLGKAEHMLRRALGGQYVSEWKARRKFAGADMRWFSPYRAPAAAGLIELVSH